MQYEYDSWNRIQKMTYPDGEEVHYDYNLGGMLEKVYGQYKRSNMEPQIPIPHDSLIVRPMQMNTMGLNVSPGDIGPFPLYTIYTYPYIDSIAYNEFEQKSEVFYGNGTHALYAYDSLLRLLLLQSQTRTGDIMQDIVYTYDSVGNITGITNSAGMLPNGLGGTYNSAYMYDDLYRLSYATGTWTGISTLNYQTKIDYLANGRIGQKNLTARRLLNGNSDTVNYSHQYFYENTLQPNTLSRYSSFVREPNGWLGISNEEDSQFMWNAAGNMTESCIGGTQNCRNLCWDEQNRLHGVRDNEWLSYYQYDANGDRTYKLTGKGNLQNVSGEWHYFYNLENATIYASPYLVATDKGYTKHYYAESERIASKVGGGGLSDLDNPIVGQVKISEKEGYFAEHTSLVIKGCLQTEYFNVQAPIYKLYDWRDSVLPETDCYWYHPDHLGSSSWVTDTGGTAVQHLHYLPWGEDFVNQRTGSFSSMYTFSAKEKDKETGYSYFGARYYSSDLSIWLSVDPMAAKYPSLSPYVYCADNPVRCVDPNGELFGDYFDQCGNYLGTDGIDDGNVYIILNKNKSWVLNNCSYQSDEYGVVFFDKYASNYASRPSEMSLSEDAIFNIVEHYNCTTLPLEKGDKTKDELLTTRTLEIDINNDGKIDLYKQKLLCNTMAWINNILSLDNYYNIRSSYDNESHHIETFNAMGGSAYLGVSNPVREINAINYQKNQINYQKTSEVFKKGIDSYYLEMLKQLK